MKLTIRKSDALDDWYVIERAEHDGRSWLEPTQYGVAFQCSARISDADVEGYASEMLAIADAIEAGTVARFKRCAVDATSDVVRFWSPRNSMREARFRSPPRVSWPRRSVK
jgi:hypothetical protein